MLKSRVRLSYNGVERIAHPVYGENVKVTKTKAEGQQYFRSVLNGDFTFIREDYEAIMMQPFGTEFTLKVYSVNETGIETPFAYAKFTMLNCKVDLDHNNLTVSLVSTDKYDAIIGGLDREYNLVDIAPERDTVTYQKRPILQFYYAGDTSVTNVIGGASYLVDLNRDPIVLEEDLENAHFTPVVSEGMFVIDADTFNSQEYKDRFAATYGVYKGRVEGFENWFYSPENPNYKIKVYGESRFHDKYEMEVIDTRTEEVVFYGTRPDNLPLIGPFTAVLDFEVEIGTIDASAPLYVRMLLGTDVDVPGAVERGSEDVVDSNFNYKYVWSPDNTILPLIMAGIKQSSEKTAEATKWGKAPNGEYYVQPSSTVNGVVIPIGMNVWSTYSAWYDTNGTLPVPYPVNVVVTLRDAYSLENAISALLRRIDPTIKWCEPNEPKQAYSAFLFGENGDYVNPITESVNKIFVTPITNIKSSYYSEASQRGTMRLQDIFDMLAKCYQAYWFIDTENRLRIEHIKWFMNGGSYVEKEHTLIADIRTMAVPRSLIPWATCQNAYEFTSAKLKKRYEFKWAIDGTAPFNGYAMQAQEEWIDSGNKVDNTVNNFFSDIDYILSNPSQVSDDCFALLVTDSANLVTIRDVGRYALQNGKASFLYLEQNFYPYAMPTVNVVLEDTDSRVVVEPDYLVKAKKGEVTFPTTVESIEADYGVVITDIGVGEINKIELSLSTMIADIELYYETE